MSVTRHSPARFPCVFATPPISSATLRCSPSVLWGESQLSYFDRNVSSFSLTFASNVCSVAILGGFWPVVAVAFWWSHGSVVLIKVCQSEKKSQLVNGVINGFCEHAKRRKLIAMMKEFRVRFAYHARNRFFSSSPGSRIGPRPRAKAIIVKNR